MNDDVSPDFDRRKLRLRRATLDDEAPVLEFIQKGLDGSIHPALDTSERSPLAVRGLEEGTKNLVFCERPVGEHHHLRSVDEASLDTLLRPPLRLIGLESSLPSDELEIIYEPCKKAEISLAAAMKKYQTAGKKPEVDLNKSYTWTDADAALQAFAQQAYEQEQEYSRDVLRGFLGRIRKGVRIFSDNANNMKGFVGLIPSQDNYLSVLCGGLKLICSIGKRISDVRNAVTEFFQELQILINGKHKLINLYVESRDLHHRNSEFCLSVLNVIEAVVQWMNENPGKKFGKASIKPADYEQGILDKIKTMKQRANDFLQEADICSKEDGRETLFTIKTFKAEAAERNEKMQQQSEKTQQQIEKTQQQIETLQNAFVFWLSDPYARPASHNRHNQGESRTTNRYRLVDLLQRCSYDPQLIIKDAQQLLRLRYTLDRSDQDRAVALMQDERLRTLVKEGHWPGQLLIHGAGLPVENSPTSFVCASLFQALRNTAHGNAAGIIPLAFFCGQHMKEHHDEMAHPPGMLLSLLLQLIEQIQCQKISVENEAVQKKVKHLKTGDVESIADLMTSTVENLSDDTIVFILIDGISFYEDDGRRKEMLIAVRRLLELGTNERGPTVKLLMTAPASTLSAWKVFRDYEDTGYVDIVEMHRNYPPQHGFAALDWAVSDDNDATSD